MPFQSAYTARFAAGGTLNLMKSLLRPGPAASSLGPVPTTGAVAPGANFFEFQK
jgi:hypothetical protein